MIVIANGSLIQMVRKVKDVEKKQFVFYFFFVLIFAILGSSYICAEPFNIEKVDAQKNFSSSKIATDSKGIHIAYGGDSLYYAYISYYGYISGAAWSYETVDSSPGVGFRMPPLTWMEVARHT